MHAAVALEMPQRSVSISSCLHSSQGACTVSTQGQGGLCVVGCIWFKKHSTGAVQAITAKKHSPVLGDLSISACLRLSRGTCVVSSNGTGWAVCTQHSTAQHGRVEHA